MYKILENYLKNVLHKSEPNVRHINPDYVYSNKIIFTYDHEHNYDRRDIKQEVNIWELLEYMFSKIENNE